MNTVFDFAKMHGAGNDFVVLSDPDARFPLDDPGLVRRICAPRSGLVCEGLLALRKADAPAGTDFRMVFFNPDGSRAAMCGNGARCAALFALRAGFAPRRMAFATDAGTVEAEVREEGETPAGARVTVRTTDVRSAEEALFAAGGEAGTPPPPFGDAGVRAVRLDSGVPHAVSFVRPDELDALDVSAAGAFVRWHPLAAPAGTNADFAAVEGPGRLRLRTFERGVEGETAACGTGVVAAAVAAVLRGLLPGFPVAVRVAFGDTLGVDCSSWAPGADPLARGLRLSGPARFVCRGVLDTGFFA
jgi:diaminopimelate epimerase